MGVEKSRNKTEYPVNKNKKPDAGLETELGEMLAEQFVEVEYESANVKDPEQKKTISEAPIPEPKKQEPLEQTRAARSAPRQEKPEPEPKKQEPLEQTRATRSAPRQLQPEVPASVRARSGKTQGTSEKPASGKTNVAVVYSEKHREHTSAQLGMQSPERPERLTEAMGYLKGHKIFNDERCDLVSGFDEATEEDLLRVHTRSHVDFIRSYAQKGGGFLGDSTYVTKKSYDIARLAAGGGIKAADLVLSGGYSYAFALIRPPGHHAGAGKYGGFCLFNNAAVLARYLQQVRHLDRIMIIDWDAHAGNGTTDIFYHDPTVMTVSVHRDPHSFYPHTGFTSQIGGGKGKGYNVNVEMPVGSGDDEYKLAFEEVVVPLIKRFSPDFVICCCGFDAHYLEKNIRLNLTSEGYYQMMRSIASVVPSKLVILLEGGYHKFVGQLSHTVIWALLERQNPVPDNRAVTNYNRNIQKKIYNEAELKISDARKSSLRLDLY